MPIDFKDEKSRSARRAKRRKTNIILNTLIAIVLVLILLVGGSIFFGGGSETEQAGSPPDNHESDSEQTEQTQEATAEVEPNEEQGNEESTEEDEKSDEIREMDSDEPNVEKVIVNPSWKPIGTEQNGHQSSYNMGTTDWNEKLQAAAYAIGISAENMTAWWVTGGEDPENQAVLTVSEKGSDDTYRVYIEWISGEGWKPVEVKKLIENDKR